MKLFKTIKRVVPQFFEILYWSVFRIIQEDWFDEEKGKYVPPVEKVRAFHVSRDTWDGEQSLMWYLIDIRIPHMFHNIRKYGNHIYWCIYSHSILSESDRSWAINYIYKKYLLTSNYEDIDYNFSVTHTEWFRDKDTAKLLEKQTKKSIKCWENQLHICDYNGVKYYLCAKSEYLDLGTSKIEYYVGHYENDDFIKDIYIKDYSEKALYKALIEKGIHTQNYFDTIISSEQYFNVKPKDLKLLSDEIKKELHGNRETLTDLLKLRRLLKKALRLDSFDEKYRLTDKECENLSQSEKQKLLKEKYKLFKNDKKEAYRAVADLIAERANGWWD